MDKANRAMHVAEDNTAEINALRQRLPVRKLMTGEQNGNSTDFGTVAISSPCAVVVTFDGGACALTFCGEAVCSGTSPMIALLPAGRGNLALDGARENARALLL